MQFGSECARRFYASIDLSPDWAPLSQVIIVLIFAELAPMFAARRYAEHVTMLGIPIIYFTSLIMRPILYCLDLICRLIHRLLRVSTASGLYLSREEIQKAIEEREDAVIETEEKGYDPVLVNIFSLKTKTAKDLMKPLSEVQLISSDATVQELNEFLGLEISPFVPIYHRERCNIIAIAYPRDFLRLPPETRIRAYSRSPWFITEKNSILEIIKEFRSNNQSVAVVLSEVGVATGILTLDAVVDEIFGHRDAWVSFGEFAPEKHLVLIDRSFPGDTKILDLNRWFGIKLEGEEGETLEEFMARHLDHHPNQGESIRVGAFEFTVEESSLIAGKTILIQSEAGF